MELIIVSQDTKQIKFHYAKKCLIFLLFVHTSSAFLSCFFTLLLRQSLTESGAHWLGFTDQPVRSTSVSPVQGLQSFIAVLGFLHGSEDPNLGPHISALTISSLCHPPASSLTILYSLFSITFPKCSLGHQMYNKISPLTNGS